LGQHCKNYLIDFLTSMYTLIHENTNAGSYSNSIRGKLKRKCSKYWCKLKLTKLSLSSE